MRICRDKKYMKKKLSSLSHKEIEPVEWLGVVFHWKHCKFNWTHTSMLFIFEVQIALVIYYYMLTRMGRGILYYIRFSTLWFS